MKLKNLLPVTDLLDLKRYMVSYCIDGIQVQGISVIEKNRKEVIKFFQGFTKYGSKIKILKIKEVKFE